MARKASFVLAACDDGPMLLPRLDHDPGSGTLGVGMTLLEKGSQSQHELDTLIQLTLQRRKQRGGGVMVLDGGANVGTFTIGWAKAMTGWGSVIAIEAQERIFGALWGNIILNNLENARAVHGVLSRASEMMAQPVPQYDQPGHFSGVSMLPRFNRQVGQELVYGRLVRTMTIDDLGLPRLDVLKLDVEGMECQALQGGERTLWRERPVIFAEVMMSGIAEVSRCLPPGYRHVVLANDILAMPADDPAWSMIEITDAA